MSLQPSSGKRTSLVDVAWSALPELGRAVAAMRTYAMRYDRILGLVENGQNVEAMLALSHVNEMADVFEAEYGVRLATVCDLEAWLAEVAMRPGASHAVIRCGTRRLFFRLGYVDGLGGYLPDDTAPPPPTTVEEAEIEEEMGPLLRAVRDVVLPDYMAGLTAGLAEGGLIQSEDGRTLVADLALAQAEILAGPEPAGDAESVRAWLHAALQKERPWSASDEDGEMVADLVRGAADVCARRWATERVLERWPEKGSEARACVAMLADLEHEVAGADVADAVGWRLLMCGSSPERVARVLGDAMATDRGPGREGDVGDLFRELDAALSVPVRGGTLPPERRARQVGERSEARGDRPLPLAREELLAEAGRVLSGRAPSGPAPGEDLAWGARMAAELLSFDVLTRPLGAHAHAQAVGRTLCEVLATLGRPMANEVEPDVTAYLFLERKIAERSRLSAFGEFDRQLLIEAAHGAALALLEGTGGTEWRQARAELEIVALAEDGGLRDALVWAEAYRREAAGAAEAEQALLLARARILETTVEIEIRRTLMAQALGSAEDWRSENPLEELEQLVRALEALRRFSEEAFGDAGVRSRAEGWALPVLIAAHRVNVR